MREVDLVVEDETTALTPVEGTAEGWRLQLERERPELCRLIGAISWVVLAIALVYELPQLIAIHGGALGVDIEATLTLPGPVNFVLGIAALAAALERACDSRATPGSASRPTNQRRRCARPRSG